MSTDLKEPDWSGSKTLLSACWKNPLYPMNERLEMADGAVRWRNEVIANLRNQLEQAKADAARRDSSLQSSIEELLEYIDEPPERNCSCHVSPPCSDCVDYSHLREVIASAKKVIHSQPAQVQS